MKTITLNNEGKFVQDRAIVRELYSKPDYYSKIWNFIMAETTFKTSKSSMRGELYIGSYDALLKRLVSGKGRNRSQITKRQLVKALKYFENCLIYWTGKCMCLGHYEGKNGVVLQVLPYDDIQSFKKGLNVRLRSSRGYDVNNFSSLQKHKSSLTNVTNDKHISNTEKAENVDKSLIKTSKELIKTFKTKGKDLLNNSNNSEFETI